MNKHRFVDFDNDIESLNACKQKWATLDIGRKIELLRGARLRTGKYSSEWVKLSLKHKKIDPTSQYAGEEWSSGPWAVAYALSEYEKTLRLIRDGKLRKLIKRIKKRENGQLLLRVFPSNLYDRIILNGISADIWMQKEVTTENLDDNIAVFYRKKTHKGKVCLVLGAGNINAIPPLDVLYKMVVEGCVVLLKLNPVNEYLAPVLGKIFEEWIAEGFLKIVGGGAEEGSYLTHHGGIDTIHITGSEDSHNAIVFGTGPEAEQRRMENKPLLDPSKTITSELGSVGPLIVVPGPWTKADLAYQAENIVTTRFHNNGYNCIATQVVVMPTEWESAKTLSELILKTIHALPDREAYYPGTSNRLDEASKQYPNAEKINSKAGRMIIQNIDSNSENEPAFQKEFFGPVLAQTNLKGSTPAGFLRQAVSFCNEKLRGTLGVTLIIHPKTIKQLGPEFENCLAELKYGAISINVWSAAAFLIPQSPWGAFPGHTLNDIKTGTGKVRNSLMLEKTEKIVYYGPFRPLPRALNLVPPRAPWFVTSRTASPTMRKITRFAANPSPGYLPGIIWSAIRG